MIPSATFRPNKKDFYNLSNNIVMTPKEKALELLFKYCTTIDIGRLNSAINSALIAVNEIIEQLEVLDIDDGDADENRIEINNKCNYWQEVKSELEKLK